MRPLFWQAWLVALACVATPGCSGCACACTMRQPTPHLTRDASFADVGTDAGTDAAGPTDVCGNGLDDDRNGEVDEHCVCVVGETMPCYGGPPASARVGLCTLGEMRCISVGGFGTWDDCVGWTPPASELCDPPGLDEDCDGDVDDGCPVVAGAMQPCFDGTDAQRGVGACVAGMQSVVTVPGLDGDHLGWGPCVGGAGPTGEACNGIDDDCDGVIDDGADERCNLADDDCDGAIDEDTACGAEGAYWTRFWTPSPPGILPPFASIHRRASDLPVPSSCPTGMLWLETSRGNLTCVAAPPTDCADGMRAEWIGGGWACVPCGVVVQMDTPRFFERRCEAAPNFDCPDGPTELTLHDETWLCVAGCAPGAPASFLDGRKLCLGP